MIRKAILFAGAVGLASSAAFADSLGTVQMRYIGNGMIKSGLNYRAIEGGTTHSASRAGNLRYQTRNATGQADNFAGSPLSSFCIELAQHTNSSYRTYNVVDLSQAPNPSGNGPDHSQFTTGVISRINAVLRAAIDLGYIDAQLQTTATSTANNQAAVQLGIWEAIWESTDSSLNLASGNSKLVNNSYNSMSGVMSSANQLVSGANTYLLNLGGLQFVSGLRALTNDTYQDQLVVVPLPTAAWAGLGLLGFVVGIRRLRKA